MRRVTRILIVAWPCLLAVGVLTTMSTQASQAPASQPQSAPPSAVQQPAPPQTAAAAPSTPERQLLQRYCFSCHNQRTKTAGLMLDTFDPSNVAPGAETWEKVIRKLTSGAMPPPNRPRPDNAARLSMIHYLETALDEAAAANPNPGRTDSVHRLNRAEYRNAVRDLLGVEIEPSLLPADEVGGNGFDNMAASLTVTPALMERYISAARKISQLIVGPPPAGLVGDVL